MCSGLDLHIKQIVEPLTKRYLTGPYFKNNGPFFPPRRSLDSLLNKTTQVLSVVETHLVEVEGDTLFLYGSGALESLDRNWSVQTAGSVITIFFIFIDFDEIVPVLPKLKIKFPNCVVSNLFLSFL